MLILYLLILLLTFYKVKVNIKGYYEDYLGLKQCDAIKGICILLVFCRHIWSYFQNVGYVSNGIFDDIFIFINSHLGQLIVVMFLFYSGYGVMESYNNKGIEYVNSFPTKRILTTLINFDVSVVFYVIVNILLDIQFPPNEIALSFIGWSSVGNSNWYIFVIILCYVCTYIGFTCTRNRENTTLQLSITFLSLFILFVFLLMTKQIWWYNTLFAYPLGLIYSKYKKQIEKRITNNIEISVACCFMIIFIAHFIPNQIAAIKDNIVAMSFALLVVFVTLKIKVGNAILLWLGANVFPLYIYQRVPMIVLANINNGAIITTCPYMYILICLLVTLLFGMGFKYWKISLIHNK